MAQAKGTTIVGFVRFLRAQKQRAFQALPPNLHSYLEKRVLAASWYPEEDLLSLIRASLELTPGSPEYILRGFGRMVAAEHLQGGTYAYLGDTSEPLKLPSRIGALWSSQHDTGEMKVEIGTQQGTMTLAGYDHPSKEVCTILTGYLQGVLESAQLSHPYVQKTSCVRSGDPICTWEFTWR